MESLVLHPDCQAGPIRSVNAQIEPTRKGCRAVFEARGDIAAIHVPEPAAAKREDGLWRATCFEIFWQSDGGNQYREFNLSPSSKWAAYDFDSFREGMRDAPVETVAVSVRHEETILRLDAEIEAELPLPASVALNGIVEDAAGAIQFWALAFPDGKAEFHSEACRMLRLGARQ